MKSSSSATCDVLYDACALDNTSDWDTYPGTVVLTFNTDHYYFSTGILYGYFSQYKSVVSGHYYKISSQIRNYSFITKPSYHRIVTNAGTYTSEVIYPSDEWQTLERIIYVGTTDTEARIEICLSPASTALEIKDICIQDLGTDWSSSFSSSFSSVASSSSSSKSSSSQSSSSNSISSSTSSLESISSSSESTTYTYVGRILFKSYLDVKY